jgi:hypothetical protein
MILGARYEPGPHTLPVGAGHGGLCWSLLDGERLPALARIWWADEALAGRVAADTAHLRPEWELQPA